MATNIVASSVYYRAPQEALNAAFVKDITHKDGEVLAPGTQFVKVWEMTNPGPEVWPEGVILQFVGGDRMFNDDDVDAKTPEAPAPQARINEYVCISMPLKAPSTPGRYISYVEDDWMMQRWCYISVITISLSLLIK